MGEGRLSDRDLLIPGSWYWLLNHKFRSYSSAKNLFQLLNIRTKSLRNKRTDGLCGSSGLGTHDTVIKEGDRERTSQKVFRNPRKKRRDDFLVRFLRSVSGRVWGRVRRFRKKKFFASKRNEAKRDPFRMRFARSREKNIFFRFFSLRIFSFRPKRN